MAKQSDIKRAAERAYQQGYRAGRLAQPPSPPPIHRPPAIPIEQLPRSKRLLLAAHVVELGTSSIQDAARSMEWARNFLADGMKMLDEILSEVELVATHPFASAIEARRAAATQIDAVHESAGPQDDAQGEPA